MDIKSLSDDELLALYKEKDQECLSHSFALFSGYNARDVDILVKINKKRKLIQLVNTMAHGNTCLFENLLGTVRYVETAIVNRAHHVHNLIVRDKNGLSSDGEIVDGALVLDTVPGLHEWLGSVDINSLYPSVIRALNISPEMIIGQFISGNCSKDLKSNGRRFAPENNSQLPEWKRALVSRNFDRKNPNRPPDIGGTTDGEYDWAGIIEGDHLEHTLRLGEVGKSQLGTDEDYLTFTGAEWLDVFGSQKWAISAYGTVFDQSRGLGIISAALEAWYSERKELQAQKKIWQLEVKRLIKEGGTQAEIDAAELKVEDFELMQMSKKLTLNSTYGAMLSPHFGLGRKEMGASVTACGRAITNHMVTSIAEQITGKKAEVTWYFGDSKKHNRGDEESFNSKRSACFIVDDQRISDVTLLSDTDSVVGSTKIKTSIGEVPIEEFFNQCSEKILDSKGREFGITNQYALGFTDEVKMMPVKFVYRHKTKKKLYRICTENGSSIDVTEDHSVMIRRNGEMIGVKPTEINTDTDVCIGENYEMSRV